MQVVVLTHDICNYYMTKNPENITESLCALIESILISKQDLRLINSSVSSEGVVWGFESVIASSEPNRF